MAQPPKPVLPALPALPVLPSARWIAPQRSLASCVRVMATRSTLGCGPMPPADRINRFPAHAYCSITWFVQDPPTFLEPSGDTWCGRVLPAVMFGGPRTRPVAVQHAAPMIGFTLALFPQALHALTGIAVAGHLDCFAPLDEVLDASWQDMSKQVLAAPDDDERVRLIEQFLEPRWQAVRAAKPTRGAVIGDWVRMLAAQAAAASANQSERNFERRIKAWAGQPLRRLRRLERAEQSFVEARERRQSGDLSWAELAAQRGYADQAHLCRDMREITGHSPAELARKWEEDESYWADRIWS